MAIYLISRDAYFLIFIFTFIYHWVVDTHIFEDTIEMLLKYSSVFTLLLGLSYLLV